MVRSGRDRRAVRVMSDLDIGYAHAKRLVVETLTNREVTSYDDVLAGCREALEAERNRKS